MNRTIAAELATGMLAQQSVVNSMEGECGTRRIRFFSR
jgi:hypothetical protein